MGTGFFPEVKSSRGHGTVELYLYPPSGPHRACNGITLTLQETLGGIENIEDDKRSEIFVTNENVEKVRFHE